MSFNDLETKRGGAVGVRPSGQANDFKSLSDDLQAYQRSWMRLKDKIPDMRRRKVGMAEKNELETQIRDIRETESRLKSQLELHSRQLDALQRDATVAQKRIALGKLSKDFDRVKLGVQAIIGEASLIKVAAIEGGGGGGDGFNRRGGGPGSGVAGGGGERDFGADDDSGAAAVAASKHEHIFQQAIVGRDVDDLIMEERERDIRKMNQDLLMVNEMFKDMANIVEQQGEHIETIAVTTEKSHDRAKAGLEQGNARRTTVAAFCNDFAIRTPLCVSINCTHKS